MAKFSERRRYVLCVIQPSTRSTLGEYDSRPPLARYVWYVTWYLRSSCCSETHYAHVKLPVFLPLSTLDVTHVRKCTRPSPLYRTASDGKLGMGLGTRLPGFHIGIHWSISRDKPEQKTPNCCSPLPSLHPPLPPLLTFPSSSIVTVVSSPCASSPSFSLGSPH